MKNNKVLEFIKNFHIANGYYPSYSEIANACKMSKGSVTLTIRELEIAGKLVKPVKISRSYILTEVKNEN